MHWHLVTGEFPPQPGGVSDYTLSVAGGLASAGESVHVWCPTSSGPVPQVPGVVVHATAGTWSRDDIARVDSELDATPRPRRLLVQWVPHAYGQRSMNVGFCRWVRRRGRRGDVVELMAHEVALGFREGSWKQDVAATVHRFMVSLLLSVSRRVWVSIPAWVDHMRPYAFGRQIEFCWLPVPSNVAVAGDAAAVRAARARYAAPGGTLIGHFGTYALGTRRELEPLLERVASLSASTSFVLMGRESDAFRLELIARYPELAARVHATGALPPETLSVVLQACDVVAQPYADGASSRRGTLMAALAHGIPVVTTEGRLSEPVWRESRAVRLVPPGETDAMAREILALGNDATERARLMSAGRALYNERFDLSHTIRALVAERCRAA
jgi:glycosyltransferase involved in cell wall biosynthesis